MDPEGRKNGGSYLWNNEVKLPYPMLDIVEYNSRRIMMIPHPITTTSNQIYVSYTSYWKVEIFEYWYQNSPLTTPTNVTVSPITIPLI